MPSAGSFQALHLTGAQAPYNKSLDGSWSRVPSCSSGRVVPEPPVSSLAFQHRLCCRASDHRPSEEYRPLSRPLCQKIAWAAYHRILHRHPAHRCFFKDDVDPVHFCRFYSDPACYAIISGPDPSPLTRAIISLPSPPPFKKGGP